MDFRNSYLAFDRQPTCQFFQQFRNPSAEDKASVSDQRLACDVARGV
jgi:hypothetical protein